MIDNKSHCLLYFFIAAIALWLSFTLSHGDSTSWVAMNDRLKIWDAVVANRKGLALNSARTEYTVSENGLVATFERDDATWSILGANAAIVVPTVFPSHWEIKNSHFDIVILDDPITNNKMLPFTEHIKKSSNRAAISIIGAPDSYESASFVIRTGEMELKGVTIEPTVMIFHPKSKATVSAPKGIEYGIKHLTKGALSAAIIPRECIDIRVVKCWYQAGDAINDTNHKVLTPELLLYDDNMIEVDYSHQVNIIKNLKTITDADHLLPFTILKRQNKQVWVTIHIKDGLKPGLYSGRIKITPQNAPTRKIEMFVTVLPFRLPPPLIDYGLFYEGRLSETNEFVISAGSKTTNQMKSELLDMKEHGLSNATVWHTLSRHPMDQEKDWQRLKNTLQLRKDIGWGDKPLLYLDWKVSLAEKLEEYRNKLLRIKSIANENGIKDIYIYGRDEAVGKELKETDKWLYKLHKNEGLKTFVAGWIREFLDKTHNLDLVIVSGPLLEMEPKSTYGGSSVSQIRAAKERGLKVWVYNNPQAGIEEPMTYRRNFGLQLVKMGLDGTLNYAYQTGTCWNDFDNPKYRYHVMAYPTLEKPIPTIQWEGWRTAINDVRYYTFLEHISKIEAATQLSNCTNNVKECRKLIIDRIIELVQ